MLEAALASWQQSQLLALRPLARGAQFAAAGISPALCGLAMLRVAFDRTASRHVRK